MAHAISPEPVSQGATQLGVSQEKNASGSAKA
jgi:hypothetical protein